MIAERAAQKIELKFLSLAQAANPARNYIARKGPIAAPVQGSNRRGECRDPGSDSRAITQGQERE
jgi:hypothetical protein